MVKVSPRTKKTSFQVSLPEANSVAVVGDFNGWNADSSPLKKNKSGVWKADLQLDAGEYQFRYLVNENEWLNDDSAALILNDFGTENSVVEIEIPAAKKTTAKKAASKSTRSKTKA